MFEKFISLATVIGFIFMCSTPSFSQTAGGFDPYSNFGAPSEVSASMYFRVPFNSGLKRSSKEKVRFGFALKATMPKNISYSSLDYRYSLTGPYPQPLKVLDLSISKRGFKSLKINGMSFKEYKTLYADGDGEKKSKTWLYILGGAVVVVGVIVIVGASKCRNVGFGGNPGC